MRKSHCKKVKKHKKNYGTSIDDCPKVVNSRTEEGHWEGDTVVGRRNGKEAVIRKEDAELYRNPYP